ncbi:MAG: carbohydrate porin [Myxococcota bacterium]
MGQFPNRRARAGAGRSGGAVGRAADPARCALALLLLLAVLQPHAAAAAGPRTARLVQHLAESPQLLDLEPRRQLGRMGATLQLFYNQYLGWKTRGENGDATGHSGSWDLFARVDAEELVGLPGLSALLHVKSQYEEQINRDVGALSDPIDDADFDEPIYVDQLWLEQSLFDGRLRARAGFVEQQTLYDRNAYANAEDRQFMNSYFDNNPLVPLPDALSAALIVEPVPWLELATGVADADNTPRSAGFDTAFDGTHSLNAYFEAKLRTPWTRRERPLPGALRLGVFRDGRSRTVFGRVRADGSSDTDRGHWGAWLSFDQAITREDARSEQGLGVFARAGHADPDVNRIAWLWQVGGQYQGLLPGRDRDVLGLAAYHAIAGDRYRHRVDRDFRGEAAVELYYRCMLLPWLGVTPDLQYIVDPGGREGTKDAVVAVLRLRVAF